MQSTWAAKVFGDKEDPRMRLHAIFGGTLPAGGQPPAQAVEWARDTLSRAGDREHRNIPEVVRILRRAEPRLTLKTATFLAHHI